MAIVNKTRLLSWLNGSNTAKKDDPLYQLIKQLIVNQVALEAFASLNDVDLTALEAQIAAILAANFLMSTDESTTFPNSRELLAGLGIDINNLIANESTISVTGTDEEDIANAIFPNFSFTGNPYCGVKSPYSLCKSPY